MEENGGEWKRMEEIDVDRRFNLDRLDMERKEEEIFLCPAMSQVNPSRGKLS